MNYIRFNKNNFFIENISAKTLVKKYRTPFYCYSFSQIKNNFNSFKSAFKKVKPIICFSVKSNANLAILKELKKYGSGADVVGLENMSEAYGKAMVADCVVTLARKPEEKATTQRSSSSRINSNLNKPQTKEN